MIYLGDREQECGILSMCLRVFLKNGVNELGADKLVVQCSSVRKLCSKRPKMQIIDLERRG